MKKQYVISSVSSYAAEYPLDVQNADSRCTKMDFTKESS